MILVAEMFSRPSLLAVGTFASLLFSALQSVTAPNAGSFAALILSVVTLGLHVYNRVMLGKEHRLSEQLAESQKQIEEMKSRGSERDTRLQSLEDEKYKLAREFSDYKIDQIKKYESLNHKYLIVAKELTSQRDVLASGSWDSIRIQPPSDPKSVPPPTNQNPSPFPNPPDRPR